MRPHLWLALAGVLAIAAGEAGGPARAGEKPVADGAFLADALAHSAYAARASELALTRAKAAEVRRFARKVLAQERALGPALTALAVGNDVPLRFNQARGRQRAQARLAAAREDGFDRTFLSALTKDLKEWIDLAQRCAAGSGGVAARGLAAKILPTLRQRLKDANRLRKAVQ
jgi:predicted outer membrane protein